MIKDVFVFKKNSWHAKLMKFVWGYTTNDFRNMCPYFWLSVFNVVFILPILIVKLFGLFIYLLVKIGNGCVTIVDNVCEAEATKWVASKVTKVWDDPQLLDKVASTKGWGVGKDQKYAKVFNQLSREERDRLLEFYYQRQDERRERIRKAELQREEQERQRAATKAARIGKMTVRIKAVSKVLIWPLLAYVLYLLIIGVMALSTFLYNADYSWVPKVLYVLYAIIGSVAGIALALYPIVTLVAWIDCKVKGMCVSCEKRRNRIRKFFLFFTFLKWPFIWFWLLLVYIWKGMVTIWEIIVAFKTDNCPAIEWKD